MSSRSPRKFAAKTMTSLALDWPNLISRIPDATRVIPARTRYTASTVGKWLQGQTKPNGDSVFALMSHFDEFADAILEAAGRAENDKLSQVEKRRVRELLSVLAEE